MADHNNYRADFEINFGEIVQDGEGCEGVFEYTEYSSKYFLVGPSHRTLVNNFRTASEEGFFHSVSFFSNFGYNNDYIFEKEIVFEGDTYNVRAEGFVDYKVTYAEFDVTRADESCSAHAVLSGFN